MNFDPVIFNQLLVVFALAAAIRIGGAPERVGAVVLLLMFVMQTAIQIVRPQIYGTVDPVSVVMDAFALVNFTALAIYSNRMWPIWAASLQLLSLSAHFARGTDMGISPMVYGVMKGLPTWVAIIAVMAGSWGHRRMIRKFGSDPSWKAW